MHGAGVSITPQVISPMDPSFRAFSHWAPIPTSGGYPRGTRSTGFVDKFLGHARYVNTPVGSNKMFEVVEDWLIYPAKAAGAYAGGWQLPIVFKMTMNAMSGNTAAPAGECFQGIEIGTFGQGTPWASNYVTGVGPVLQLRYNFALSRWEVLVWDYDQLTAPDVVACSIQPTFAVDLEPREVGLVYSPNVGGTAILQALIDGVIVHTYSGGRLNNVPVNATSEPRGCGYFMTNGTGATQSWAEGGFYHGRVYEPFHVY